MGPPKKKKGATGDPATSVPEGHCIFCKSSEDNELKLGKIQQKQGITIHYFCMLFASGLSQRGRGDREGILGFLIPDILKEARRSGRLRCSYCKKTSATIGCSKANCRTSFHFGCGVEAGALNQFFGNFCSFCSEHRPIQVVPEQEKKMYRAKYTSCVICMSKVLAAPSVDTLRTSCCKANSWYHRDCVQRMASASGLHFCKCPLCNNKEGFQQEMMDFGIYIPDQDAAWELEPNAFQEQLERHNRCDHEECRCPRGRTFNEADTGWELVLCDWCGHQGTHVSCGRLESPEQEWVCQECVAISIDAESPLLKTKLFGKKTHKGRTKVSPLVTAAGPSASRGQKRPNQVSESQAAEKRKRLSLTGRSSSASSQSTKENQNSHTAIRNTSERLSHPGHGKKTADKAKIKSSKNNQGQGTPHGLKYYLFHGQTDHSSPSDVPKTSSSGLSPEGSKAMTALDRWLRKGSGTDAPKASPPQHAPLADSRMEVDDEISFKKEIIEERNVKKENIEDPNLTDSSDSSYSSRSRAARAQRRASANAEVEANGTKQNIKTEAFAGSNTGVKFLGLANPTSGDSSDQQHGSDSDTDSGRRARSKRGSDIKHLDITREGRPAWFRNLLDDDYLTGRNLGRKLSAASPGIHLSPGMACRLQTTHGSPPDGGIPTGRGNDSTSSNPSDHPGTVTLGHVSTVQKQEASASESDGSTSVKRGRGRPRKHPAPEPQPEKRQNMKYWEFIQHLEDIGFKHQSTIIDRLSLYQQYLEGEFQLLTCADISLSNATCGDVEREAHSPTPSLVSPNDSNWSPQEMPNDARPPVMQQSSSPNQPKSTADSIIINTAVTDETIPGSSSVEDKVVPASSTDSVTPPPQSAVNTASLVNTPAVSMPSDVDGGVSSKSQQAKEVVVAPSMSSIETVQNKAAVNSSSNVLEMETTPVMAQDPIEAPSQSLEPVPGDRSKSIITPEPKAVPAAPISEPVDKPVSNQSASAEKEALPGDNTVPKANDTNDSSEESDAYASAEEMLATEDLSKAPLIDANKIAENTPMELDDPLAVTENSPVVHEKPMESPSPTHTTEANTENTNAEMVHSNVDNTCDNPQISSKAENNAEIVAATTGVSNALSDDDDALDDYDDLDDAVLDSDDDVTKAVESDNDDTIAAITALEESLEIPQDSNMPLQAQTVGVEDLAASTMTDQVVQTDAISDEEVGPTQDSSTNDKTVGAQEVPETPTIDEQITDTPKETENTMDTSIETDSAMETSVETESAVEKASEIKKTPDTPVVQDLVQAKPAETEEVSQAPEARSEVEPGLDDAIASSTPSSSAPTQTIASDPPTVKTKAPQQTASKKTHTSTGAITDAILIEDDPELIVIEDVHTVGPTDPAHIDIEEIPTGSAPTPARQKPQIIKVDEISTGPAVIEITSDDDEPPMVQPVIAAHRKECCRHCGKKKRLKRPLSNLDTNTYYSKDPRQVIEID